MKFTKETLENLILASNAFTTKSNLVIDEYTQEFERDLENKKARY